MECKKCPKYEAEMKDLQEKLDNSEKLLALKRQENQILERQIEDLKK